MIQNCKNNCSFFLEAWGWGLLRVLPCFSLHHMDLLRRKHHFSFSSLPNTQRKIQFLHLKSLFFSYRDPNWKFTSHQHWDLWKTSCAVKFWKHLETETPQPLWATTEMQWLTDRALQPYLHFLIIKSWQKPPPFLTER